MGAGALLVVSVLLSGLGRADLSVLLGALASLLLLGGLIGLHARQAGSYGRLGVGFLLTFAGTFLGAAVGPVLVPGARVHPRLFEVLRTWRGSWDCC